MKKTLLGLVILCLFFSTAFAQAPSPSPEAESKNIGTAKIRVFKVGKADASLILCEGSSILIDTAEDDDAEDILSYMAQKQVSSLDCLILTHFSKNNIGSAAEILDKIPTKRILMPDTPKDSKVYRDLMDFLAAYPVKAERVTQLTEFRVGPITLSLIPSATSPAPDVDNNDLGLVVLARHGENRLLFPGDIGPRRFEELEKSGIDLTASLLILPNHGKNAEGLEAFLAGVKAQTCIITCSLKNPPAGAVDALLQKLKLRVYLSHQGGITITSDGHAMTYKQ